MGEEKGGEVENVANVGIFTLERFFSMIFPTRHPLSLRSLASYSTILDSRQDLATYSLMPTCGPLYKNDFTLDT